MDETFNVAKLVRNVVILTVINQPKTTDICFQLQIDRI